jgi:hypothetical protein
VKKDCDDDRFFGRARERGRRQRENKSRHGFFVLFTAAAASEGRKSPSNHPKITA